MCSDTVTSRFQKAQWCSLLPVKWNSGSEDSLRGHLYFVSVMILFKDWNAFFFSCHTALHPKKLFVPCTAINKVSFYLEFCPTCSTEPHFLSTPLLRTCSKHIWPCQPTCPVAPCEMMVFPQPALKYPLAPCGLSQILHPLCVLYLSFCGSIRDSTGHGWSGTLGMMTDWFASQLWPNSRDDCCFPCLSLKEIIKNDTLLPSFVENTKFNKTWRDWGPYPVSDLTEVLS